MGAGDTFLRIQNLFTPSLSVLRAINLAAGSRGTILWFLTIFVILFMIIMYKLLYIQFLMSSQEDSLLFIGKQCTSWINRHLLFHFVKKWMREFKIWYLKNGIWNISLFQTLSYGTANRVTGKMVEITTKHYQQVSGHI